MLLRDLTVARHAARRCSTRANFLFVPIFNVDGHERSLAVRAHQPARARRTPAGAPPRATSTSTATTPSSTRPRCGRWSRALSDWAPDLYLDLHVTDGADYQYDITFGWHGRHGYSPAAAAWLDEHAPPGAGSRPRGRRAHPRAADHLRRRHRSGAGPRRLDRAAALLERLRRRRATCRRCWSRTTRSSPTAQRVLGTRVLLEAMLATLGARGADLRAAIAKRSARRAPPSCRWRWAARPRRRRQIDLRGHRVRGSRPRQSPAAPRSCGRASRYAAGCPSCASDAVERRRAARRPTGFQPAWPDVIERLRLARHRAWSASAAPRDVEVEIDRLSNAKLARRARSRATSR